MTIRKILTEPDPFLRQKSIKVEQVNGNMEGLKAWRDMLQCNHVLKYQGNYLMVRTVEDAKIIK